MSVEPSTTGNLSIGNEFSVEHGLTVTEGFSEGNRLSLPGFNGPYPVVELSWGPTLILEWGFNNFLEW